MQFQTACMFGYTCHGNQNHAEFLGIKNKYMNIPLAYMHTEYILYWSYWIAYQTVIDKMTIVLHTNSLFCRGHFEANLFELKLLYFDLNCLQYVQITTWRQIGTGHNLTKWWHILLTYICAVWPLWINNHSIVRFIEIFSHAWCCLLDKNICKITNLLKPKQNGRHFVEDIFDNAFRSGNVSIFDSFSQYLKELWRR